MATDQKTRAERTDVSLSAKLRAGGSSFACSMQNLSVGGAKVISDQTFGKGSEVELVIGNLSPIKARVVWARAPLYGLKFDADAQEEVAQILMSVATYAGG